MRNVFVCVTVTFFSLTHTSLDEDLVKKSLVDDFFIDTNPSKEINEGEKYIF
jgi:hypothetical protein